MTPTWGSFTFVPALMGSGGIGEAWVSRRDVSEFAERLRQYPLDSGNPVVLSAGLGAGDDYVEFIAMSAAPRGFKGQVTMSIRVAAEEWRDGEPVPIHETRMEFPTPYEALRRFAGQLDAVLDGHSHEALLAALTLG